MWRLIYLLQMENNNAKRGKCNIKKKQVLQHSMELPVVFNVEDNWTAMTYSIIIGSDIIIGTRIYVYI